MWEVEAHFMRSCFGTSCFPNTPSTSNKESTSRKKSTKSMPEKRYVSLHLLLRFYPYPHPQSSTPNLSLLSHNSGTDRVISRRSMIWQLCTILPRTWSVICNRLALSVPRNFCYQRDGYFVGSAPKRPS